MGIFQLALFDKALLSKFKEDLELNNNINSEYIKTLFRSIQEIGISGISQRNYIDKFYETYLQNKYLDRNDDIIIQSL